MGYHRAGFEVTGIDIEPQRNYPFTFHLGNAMKIKKSFLQTFDLIHASPPCQRYSVSTPKARREQYPDLLPPMRDMLEDAGVPYIIENVPGAPMWSDFILCGCNFRLPLRRKRWFETSWSKTVPPMQCFHNGPVVSVVGNGTPSWVRDKFGYNPTIDHYRAAMGIDWMNRSELSQAIPPAYTRYLGHQYMVAKAGSFRLKQRMG